MRHPSLRLSSATKWQWTLCLNKEIISMALSHKHRYGYFRNNSVVTSIYLYHLMVKKASLLSPIPYQRNIRSHIMLSLADVHDIRRIRRKLCTTVKNMSLVSWQHLCFLILVFKNIVWSKLVDTVTFLAKILEIGSTPRCDPTKHCERASRSSSASSPTLPSFMLCNILWFYTAMNELLMANCNVSSRKRRRAAYQRCEHQLPT